MRGCVFDTPAFLSLRRRRTQQRAIATTHQREAALNQANGPIAQIVRPPVAFGNARGAEKDLRDFPIGAAVHPCIERAQGERQSPTAMHGKCMQRRSLRPAIEGAPQATCCIRAKFKIAVEPKFDSIGNGSDRRFFQPNAVLHAP
jgi:hypothetical protein